MTTISKRILLFRKLDNNNTIKEIRWPIKLSKQAFEKQRTLITNKHPSITFSFIWFWIVDDRLETTKIWWCMRMITTRWIKNKINEVVLGKVNERKTVMSMIMNRKIKLYRYLLRHSPIIGIIMKEKTNGKRTKDHVNPSLKKSSIGWRLPHTNNSRRQQETDIKGYNDNTWLLRPEDDRNKNVIFVHEKTKNNLFLINLSRIKRYWV